ncbi:MAG: trypsin-like peptidase domain-containing protein [Oscillospiraceae bacterium]|nr:trypsin-like peptidase domain-containing protein [Oscillospiraceae bacterium]
MDQFDEILHLLDDPGTKPPQEVVLRYEAPEPKPIVERYIAPQPLPGRRKTPPKAPVILELDDIMSQRSSPAADAEPPKHSRTGLRIFLICTAALLIALLFLGVRSLLPAEEAQDEEHFHFETERRSGAVEHDGVKTTIARFPNSSGVRLRYAEDHGDELRIQEVYERVNPCTVTVVTALPGGTAIIGTGVIFTSDGYIVTNAHVIAGGTECYAVLANGTHYAAKLVGYDAEQDLAVIKVSAMGLPTAEFGDSDQLTVGDTVYAIGNPLGVQLRGTLTDGIVSAINRDVMVDGISMTLIQTNAALNNGNSGGPLINIYGQVVGINTMKMGDDGSMNVEGLGFAIPVSFAAWMVDDLIEYGEIRGEPMLGITVQTIPASPGETYLSVYEVMAGSTAEDADVAAGDRIVSADGEPVSEINDLLRIRRRHRAGEAVTLELERNGERLTVDIILKENALK